MKTIYRYKWFTALLLVPLTGCEDFIEPELPATQTSSTQVFEDVATADAAMQENYIRLRDRVLLTGNANGVGALMGLYTDELQNWKLSSADAQSFYTNTVFPQNGILTQFWNESYSVVYNCNKIIEGLAASSGISESHRNRITGEALFVRTMVHFYLLQLFGDIPYVTGTDYRLNTRIGKTDKSILYSHLVDDGRQALEFLKDQPAVTNTVANRFVVAAFMSRLHLYGKSWQDVVEYSDYVLKQGNYQLEKELEKVFLKDAKSTIWHLKPQADGNNTHEGRYYSFTSTPPPDNSMSLELVHSFETNDFRRDKWVKKVDGNSETGYYHSFKYREAQNTASSQEYSVIFRLEEMYFNRLEAYLNTGQYELALVDWNLLRTRSGLVIYEQVPADWKQKLLQERRAEFFCEFGHRFFDLKRTGMLDTEMIKTKTGWQNYFGLLPLPQAELLLNPNLLPQNEGY